MKKHIALLLAALLLLSTCAAFAEDSQGLLWYYAQRESLADQPTDIAERIQSDIPQSGENPLANVHIESAAWLGPDPVMNQPKTEVLDVLVRARVKDAAKYELHEGISINVDGEVDSEDRKADPVYGARANEDWLWAGGKHGPIDAMMQDPKKTLLLYDYSLEGYQLVVAGAPHVVLSCMSGDCLIDPANGDSVAMYKLLVDESQMKKLRKYARKNAITLTYVSSVSTYPDLTGTAATGPITFTIALPPKAKK